MKKSLIIAVIAAASLIALGGCESTPEMSSEAAAATQATATAAIAEAKKAQKAAAAAKNEWRDTGKMIKKAEGMLKKGDFAGAEKLARKAERQGHDAVAQASTQQGVGNPSYLY